MRVRRLLWFAVAPITFLLLISLWSPIAHATTNLVLDSSTSCSVTIGGTPSGSTCLLNLASFDVPSGFTLLITSGWTLQTTSSFGLTIEGAVTTDTGGSPGGIDNFGILTINSGGTLEVLSTGALTNEVGGQINDFGGLTVDSAAELTDSGVIGVGTHGTYHNPGVTHIPTGGSLTDFGTLLNEGTGTFAIDPGAAFAVSFPGYAANEGLWQNVGAMGVTGEFENSPSGTFDNADTVNIQNGALGLGFFVEDFGGLVDNSVTGQFVDNAKSIGLYVNGNFDNTGTLTADWEILIADDPFSGPTGTGEIDNSGTLQTSRAIIVYSGGTLLNDVGGRLYNPGTIEILDPGSFINLATMDNNGTTDNFGEVDDSAGSAVIFNTGNVFNECGGTILAGDIVGSPAQYLPCAPFVNPPGTVNTPTPTITGNANVGSGGGGPLMINLYANGSLVGDGFTTDSAGDWSITTSPLAAGFYTLGACAIDAQSYQNCDSNAPTLTIVIPTTTVVVCIPVSLPVGTATACSATVSETGGGPPASPLGTVAWTDPPPGMFTGSPCTLVPSGPGTSVCKVNYVPGPGSEGPITITGTYSPTDFHLGSTGSYGISAVQLASTTGVVCSPGKVPVNDPTTCTATVTDNPNNADIPPENGITITWSSTGSGVFSGGGTCTLSDLSPSSAKCSVTYTPNPGSEGTPTIHASYPGDTDHTSSSSSVGITVTKRTDTTSVSCSKPYDQSHKLYCTITVKDTSPGIKLTPTGKVTASVGGPKGFATTVTCTLSGSGGTATCKVHFTPPYNGNYTLTATYPGDTDHSGSSGAQTIKVD